MKKLKNIAIFLMVVMFLFVGLGAIYFFVRGGNIPSKDYSIFSIEGKSLEKDIFLIPNEEFKIKVKSSSDITADISINTDIAKTYSYLIETKKYNLNDLSDIAVQDLFDIKVKDNIVSIKSDFQIKNSIAQSFEVTEDKVKFITDIDLSKSYFLLNIKVGLKRYVFYVSQYISVNGIKFSNSYPTFVLEGK